MHPKKSGESKAEIPHKRLEDLMKMDLVDGKSVAEITQIWCEYHVQKEVIAAVIPTEVYERQLESAKKYPIFIFPIPRSQGFEFMMLQFAANTVHFTPLLCYQVSIHYTNFFNIFSTFIFKVHKENAPECLNMVHYTEFKEKGIILMRGEFDTKVLTSQEARCLANQLQLYYTQNDADKLQILETFTKKPEDFKHMDVIKELENLQLT